LLLTVEKLLTGPKAAFYTIRLLDKTEKEELFNETEKFFIKFEDSFPDDINVFRALFNKMQNELGARKSFFRNEDNIGCNFLKALINFTEEGKKYKDELRLYCLYYNLDRIIFGNGGIKDKRTFNEIPELVKITSVLQKLDKVLEQKEKDEEIWWDGSELKSNTKLIFEI